MTVFSKKGELFASCVGSLFVHRLVKTLFHCVCFRLRLGFTKTSDSSEKLLYLVWLTD